MSRKIDENKKRERLGETIILKDDVVAEIIGYNKATDIAVKVSSKQYDYTRIIHNIQYGDFKRKRVVWNYKPIYGKGFIDSKTKDEYGHTLTSFNVWYKLLKEGVKIPKEWCEYSKFKEIYDKGEFKNKLINIR